MARRRPVAQPEGLAPPQHLNAAAAEHWDEVLATLSIDHDLTPSDCDLLALYCDYFARWREARAEIESSGLLVKMKNEDNPRPNPFIAIADQCAREMRSLLGDLGMTPASRRKLRDLRDREITREDIASIRVTVPDAHPRH